jgi:hypothetical protein
MRFLDSSAETVLRHCSSVGIVKVPTQPVLEFAKPQHRKYASDSRSCCSNKRAAVGRFNIRPLPLTAQPVLGVTKKISSVRELATVALVLAIGIRRIAS